MTRAAMAIATRMMLVNVRSLFWSNLGKCIGEEK
jgi:hypothetical protein